MAYRRVLLALTLALSAGLAGCFGKGPEEAGAGGTAESVARTILREEAGTAAPEGVVVAACARFDPKGEPRPPFRVWRQEGGRLAEAGSGVLDVALGPDRSLWPPVTYVFSVEPGPGGGLLVNVVTHYRRGIAENSRGGNAQRWTLVRRGDGWEVTEKARTFSWD